MSKYNEKATAQKEEQGRNNYLNWIESNEACQHECFTADRWARYDCLFISGGTLMVGDIKNRNYPASFFETYGAEVDAEKGRELLRAARRLGAVPVVITCTNDNNFIVSDLRKGKPEHLSWKYYQTNDNDHNPELCQVINLSACTITNTYQIQC